MAKAKVKEIQMEFADASVIELKSIISYNEEGLAKENDSIKEYCMKLNDLDVTSKHYIRNAKEYADTIKRTVSDIEYTDSLLTILKPILEKKIKEEVVNEKYTGYLEDNKEQLSELIRTVNELEESALQRTDGFWSNLDEDEIKRIHKQLLYETVYMLMNKIGKLVEVVYVRYNPKFGLDGIFIGTERRIQVSTILAWGMINRPHYRTLIR